MASPAIQFPRIPANDYQPIPPAIALALATAPAWLLAEIVEIAIARIDDDDGDSDLEPNGDETDGTCAEDDFYDNPFDARGPGCPLADPDSDPGEGSVFISQRDVGASNGRH